MFRSMYKSKCFITTALKMANTLKVSKKNLPQTWACLSTHLSKFEAISYWSILSQNVHNGTKYSEQIFPNLKSLQKCQPGILHNGMSWSYIYVSVAKMFSTCTYEAYVYIHIQQVLNSSYFRRQSIAYFYLLLWSYQSSGKIRRTLHTFRQHSYVSPWRLCT
jgi:hypothetical protein